MHEASGSDVAPDLLRTFLAVRRRMSYSRAAEELFLSQPAVSRQVRRLEQALGVRLFEQIGKTLHLTDAGRTLEGEAERLLGVLGRVAEAVRAHRAPGRGRLRIGASTTPGHYLMPRLVGRFHRRWPGVELVYAVENSLSIERKILHNELDLGFVGAHLAHEDLELEPLARDEIVCFAAPSHPAARRSRVAPAALADELWVIREQGSATRRLFEEWLAGRGARIRRAIELPGPEACKALVRAGVGISCLSLAGLKDDLVRGRLARVRVAGLRLERPLFRVRHADKRDSPEMQAFLSLVARAFAPRRAP